MFDNPNEELKRLEKELLAAEATDDDFEAFYSEILEEFGPKEKRVVEDDDYLKASPMRKKSAPKKSAPKKGASKNTYSDSARRSSPAKKQKGIKGLVITLCLECAGIVGIIAWWILRIL